MLACLSLRNAILDHVSSASFARNNLISGSFVFSCNDHIYFTSLLSLTLPFSAKASLVYFIEDLRIIIHHYCYALPELLSCQNNDWIIIIPQHNNTFQMCVHNSKQKLDQTFPVPFCKFKYNSAIQSLKLITKMTAFLLIVDHD